MLAYHFDKFRGFSKSVINEMKCLQSAIERNGLLLQFSTLLNVLQFCHGLDIPKQRVSQIFRYYSNELETI